MGVYALLSYITHMMHGDILQRPSAILCHGVAEVDDGHSTWGADSCSPPFIEVV